jgi:hypothetical protein
MIIFIKDDKTYTLHLESTATIREVLIIFHCKSDTWGGWLEYNAKNLDQEKMLSDYFITGLSTLHYHNSAYPLRDLWSLNFYYDKKILGEETLKTKYLDEEIFPTKKNELSCTDTVDLFKTNMLEMYSSEFDDDITKKLCEHFEASMKYPFGKNAYTDYVKILINAQLDKTLINNKLKILDTYLQTANKNNLLTDNFDDLNDQQYKQTIKNCFHNPQSLDILDTFMIHLWGQDDILDRFGISEIKTLIQCAKLTCEGKEYFTTMLEGDNSDYENKIEDDDIDDIDDVDDIDDIDDDVDDVDDDDGYSDEEEFDPPAYNIPNGHHVKKTNILPKHHVTEFFDLHKMANKTIDCAICYSEIEKADDLTITGCGHKFCTDCFGHVTNNKCPACRQTL